MNEKHTAHPQAEGGAPMSARPVYCFVARVFSSLKPGVRDDDPSA